MRTKGEPVAPAGASLPVSHSHPERNCALLGVSEVQKMHALSYGRAARDGGAVTGTCHLVLAKQS